MVIGQNLDEFLSFVQAKKAHPDSFLSMVDGHDGVIVMHPSAKLDSCMDSWTKDIMNDILNIKNCQKGLGKIPEQFLSEHTDDSVRQKKTAAFVSLSNVKSHYGKHMFLKQIGTTVSTEGQTICPKPAMLLETLEGELVDLDRMRYWNEATEVMAPTEKYVLFTNDAGGLNNIRLGWEASGLIAQGTGRTLVLPPPSKMYLLDWGEMKGGHRDTDTTTLVEDIINLAQLKANVPTLTAKEFEE